MNDKKFPNHLFEQFYNDHVATLQMNHTNNSNYDELSARQTNSINCISKKVEDHQLQLMELNKLNQSLMDFIASIKDKHDAEISAIKGMVNDLSVKANKSTK